MKKFSKFHLTALTLAGLMVVTTASVGAASVYKNITARQNTAMTVKVDGTALTMKDDDGDSLYPLTYDGNTYLPAEQLASAVGYNATSDDDSVSLTRKNTVSTFPAASGDIGSEKAKSIALNHAGVTSSTAKFVKVERDRDDGRDRGARGRTGHGDRLLGDASRAGRRRGSLPGRPLGGDGPVGAGARARDGAGSAGDRASRRRA